jgi:uncharacterized coiled-coil protein SlyX
MPEQLPIPQEPTASTNAPTPGAFETAVRLVTVERQVALNNSALTQLKDQITDLKIEINKLDAKIDGVEKSLNSKFDAKINGLEKSLNAKFDGLEKSLNSFKNYAIVLLITIIAGIVVSIFTR